MPKLETLTVEQEALLPVVRDGWLGHGLSCEPADRHTAATGVADAYRTAGLEPPRLVVWLDSPLAGAIGTTMLRQGQVRDQVRGQVWDQVWDQVRGQVGDQVGDQVGGQVWDQVWGQVGGQVGDQVGGQVWDQVWGQVRGQVGDQVWGQVWDQVGDQVWGQVGDQVGGQVRGQVRGQVWGQVRDQVGDQVGYSLWGQHDAGWLAWSDVWDRLDITAGKASGLRQVGRSAGWWWALRGAAVLTDRPAELHRDPDGRLHAETGPALRYRDDWSIWAWHGFRVPAWVITDPSPQAIASEENIEVRRCAIESLGWDRYIASAGLRLVATSPDPGNPGQSIDLYDVPERLWGEPVRVAVVTNGSVERDGTRRRYGLTTPADIDEPVTAVAWTYGLDAGQYELLERRT